MKIIKNVIFTLAFSSIVVFQSTGQETPSLTNEIASKLSQMPLHCISQKYPNQPSHVIISEQDATLTPADLHPAFHGCFDWHSSVHGHWMLVRLLKTMPNLPNRAEIESTLDNSFQSDKIQTEALYFTKNDIYKVFERTYGWAWLLKLDEELYTWDSPKAKEWHKNLQPLTLQILKLWKAYLPKQTYPNRTGVHHNAAFALGFAIDWAKAVKDKEFENSLIEKAKYFYLNDKKTPAYLEPDGADFFSPSLEIADLMRRVLNLKEFTRWFNNFYERKGIARISEIPVVSDLNDYYTVHLVGLSLSRAWCMKEIAKSLPETHSQTKHFKLTANKLLINALPLLFQGNYGGDHWLASFAVFALE